MSQNETNTYIQISHLSLNAARLASSDDICTQVATKLYLEELQKKRVEKLQKVYIYIMRLMIVYKLLMWTGYWSDNFLNNLNEDDRRRRGEITEKGDGPKSPTDACLWQTVLSPKVRILNTNYDSDTFYHATTDTMISWILTIDGPYTNYKTWTTAFKLLLYN